MYLIRYDELTLKGHNRKTFEKRLIRNIEKKLHTVNDVYKNVRIARRFGKCVLDVKQQDPVIEIVLKNTPGINAFAWATSTTHDINDITNTVLSIFPSHTPTFKIDTTRTNKKVPFTSEELNKHVGAAVKERRNIKVQLKNPDTVVGINVAEKETYVYLEKKRGLGGLPVGSSGKIICLLSGGIDSPVAAFHMMKRGCEVIFLHAQSNTLYPKSVKNKVVDLVKKLTLVQGHGRLFIFPYKEIQKEIIGKISEPYRMIAFKRSLMRMACRLARMVNAKAITTGDSVGQVASQTLANINCIYSASSLPVLSPLIGIDKNTIISIAHQIGTYPISIRPYEDCCSLLATSMPMTYGKRPAIEQMEKETSLQEIERKVFGEREEIFLQLDSELLNTQTK